MIDIKPSIATGFGKGELYDILTELQLFNAKIQGEVYFVDSSTGYDGNDGKSWNKAFKTIAAAIAVSNTNRSGYERNTIFIRGKFTETLTTAPSKCDLIGVGATSARAKPRVTGSQAMTDTAYGTRFININFRGDAAAAVMTFTAGGFEIHNCTFSHAGTYTCTHGLVIANPTDVLIKGCDFEMRNEAFFSTAAIAVSSTAVVNRFKIQDCKITGAKGVHLGVTGDDNFYECSIENCFIYSSGLPVDDDTELQNVMLINNRMITQGAEDLTGMNVLYAAGNIYTSSTDTRTYPFATVSA